VRFGGWRAVVTGVLMVAEWAFFITAGQVPELTIEPVRMGFHLAAESVTAVALIGAGAGLLRGASPFALVAFGMLLYTVVVLPG